MTADVRRSGEGFLLRSVPWEAISDLEEAQDSARPGPFRETRENKSTIQRDMQLRFSGND